MNKSIFKVLPVLLGFFVMGFCDIVGLSSDYVQKTFDWSATMTGFVPSMVFIWFLFLAIPFGNLMNRWGRKNVVLISMAITFLGMIPPLFVYNSFTCITAFVFLGIGNAILQVSLHPLLSNVMSEKRLSSGITAGQVIKAISSLLGPEIVMIAIGMFGEAKWYYCFPILGLITLLSALWLLATPIERELHSEENQSVSLGDTFSLLKDNSILMLFFGIFFIVGIDVATNYVSSKVMIMNYGWSTEEARIAPQIYFLSRTIGAFLGAFMLVRIQEVKYMRANILLCILALIVMIFSRNETLSLSSIGAVGFFDAAIFPVIFSTALKKRPDKANQISGLMITGVAGGGIVTPVLGITTDISGIAGGIAVIVCCALYITLLSFRLSAKQHPAL